MANANVNAYFYGYPRLKESNYKKMFYFLQHLGGKWLQPRVLYTRGRLDDNIFDRSSYLQDLIQQKYI